MDLRAKIEEKYSGNPIFLSKLQGIQFLWSKVEAGEKPKKELESYVYSVAADYYTMAFWEEKIMHFKENSCAKKSYLLVTNPVYTNFVIALSWVYLILSFFEPGNWNSRPYEVGDRSYNIVSAIEGFIMLVFTIDAGLSIYLRYILIQ